MIILTNIIGLLEEMGYYEPHRPTVHEFFKEQGISAKVVDDTYFKLVFETAHAETLFRLKYSHILYKDIYYDHQR